MLACCLTFASAAFKNGFFVFLLLLFLVCVCVSEKVCASPIEKWMRMKLHSHLPAEVDHVHACCNSTRTMPMPLAANQRCVATKFGRTARSKCSRICRASAPRAGAT